jgi:hypothetical protein
MKKLLALGLAMAFGLSGCIWNKAQPTITGSTPTITGVVSDLKAVTKKAEAVQKFIGKDDNRIASLDKQIAAYKNSVVHKLQLMLDWLAFGLFLFGAACIASKWFPALQILPGLRAGVAAFVAAAMIGGIAVYLPTIFFWGLVAVGVCVAGAIGYLIWTMLDHTSPKKAAEITKKVLATVGIPVPVVPVATSTTAQT